MQVKHGETNGQKDDGQFDGGPREVQTLGT